MTNQQIKRRRSVALVALIVGLVMLVGAVVGGPVGAPYRGVAAVVEPVGDGLQRVTKPGADLVDWVDSSLDAKREVKQLREERDRLLLQHVHQLEMESENRELRGFRRIVADTGVPVESVTVARIIQRGVENADTTSVVVDAGSRNGIAIGDSAVAADGLVGIVSGVSDATSTVSLLTAGRVIVGVRDVRSDVLGVVRASTPPRMALSTVTRIERLDDGDVLVTAGSLGDRLRSPFPPGIPVGRISLIDESPMPDSQAIVEPFATIRRATYLLIISRGSDRVSATSP